MTERKITRLHADGDPVHGMSPWNDLLLVGDAAGNMKPKERYFRVFEEFINSPADVRAGVWQCTAYAEKVTDYPFNEIVFVVSGSMSILDQDGTEERFEPGDCFFLQKGFCGEWRQHETVKIFHMTVDPKDS